MHAYTRAEVPVVFLHQIVGQVENKEFHIQAAGKSRTNLPFKPVEIPASRCDRQPPGIELRIAESELPPIRNLPLDIAPDDGVIVIEVEIAKRDPIQGKVGAGTGDIAVTLVTHATNGDGQLVAKTDRIGMHRRSQQHCRCHQQCACQVIE